MFINTGVVANYCDITNQGSQDRFVMILDTKDGVQEYWSTSKLDLLQGNVLTEGNYRQLEQCNRLKGSLSVGKVIAKNLKLDYKSTSFKCKVHGSLTDAGILMNLHDKGYDPSYMESDDGGELFFYALGDLFLTPLYIAFSNGNTASITVITNNPVLDKVVRLATKSLIETWHNNFSGMQAFTQNNTYGLTESYYETDADFDNDNSTLCLFW